MTAASRADDEVPFLSKHGRSTQAHYQGDRAAVEGARPGDLGSPSRRQPSLLRCDHRWPRPVALRRRRVQVGAVPSGRLPDDAAQGSLPDQDLPPKHRPLGKDLPGRAEEQLVAGSPDPHHTPLHPGVVGCAEPGRPARKRRGPTVEGGSESGHRNGEGVDREVRKGIVHVNGLSMMVKEGGNWLTNPISCTNAWSISRDDDDQVFSTFGSSSDNRAMVSKWNGDPFDELKFLITKPDHPFNFKHNYVLYYGLCCPYNFL